MFRIVSARAIRDGIIRLHIEELTTNQYGGVDITSEYEIALSREELFLNTISGDISNTEMKHTLNRKIEELKETAKISSLLEGFTWK